MPHEGPAVGIWHVAFTVADLDRSVAFYCNALGFRLTSRDSDSAFISLGERGFTLEFLAAEGTASARPDHLAFEAKSLAALRERLISQGIDVGDIVKIGPRAARMALKDPDGLSLDLFEARDEIEDWMASHTNPPPAGSGDGR